jgi:site-specific recombinase XerD
MNALKFYYEQVLHRERFFFDIPRPKKRIQLPKVISEEKILMGIEKLKNLKHRVLIMAAYSAGLRVSEVVNLKITDIQSDRMQILIRQSKGKKDRMVPLSKALLEALRIYFKQYKPIDWLFEGQFPGTSISTRTAQAVFNQVYKSLGLPKGITFHSLRHSYATHLVENGIDVTFVQHLLGHNDVRTTLRYTHVSQKKINNIESPLDRALRLKNENEK